MKTGFLITARLKSTRLSEKLLREVEGRPIFSHMIERLKLAKRVDEIVVCTSTNSQDDRLETLAASEGVSCFRGHEDDVVKRLSDAATQFGLDYILSITADCPFSDPNYADRIVETFEQTDADLIRALDLPHGAYSYGVKPSAFRRVLEIKDDTNTEVWTRYFTDTDLFKVVDLPIARSHNKPDLRMTLDYPEDLEFFRAVFAQLYEPGNVFTLDEILDLLESHPEIVAINSHCATAYRKRWTRQSSIKLKSRYEVNSAVIIGLGSIGKRHVCNLRSLGIEKLFALRSGFGERANVQSDEIEVVTNWQALIDRKPDVAIICNPTSLHLEALQRCLPFVRGVFIEKPLASSLAGIDKLLIDIKEGGVTSFVGHNLQFHPVVKTIQSFVDSEASGKPLVLQCQVGQFVEDWHPASDYREAYYARKDLGGGVMRSLIHEIHLATEVLGPALRVHCILPKSDLVSLEVDVIADLMIEHVNGCVSHIHLDMIQRPAHRQGVVSCERGWVAYDLIAQTITSTSETQSLPKDSMNQSYIDEMKTFLEFVSQGKVRHEHDAWKATQCLAIVDAAFEAAETGGVSNICDWVINLK